MSLPLPLVSRTRLHERRVVFESWQRDDGLIDIEGHLTDLRDRDANLASGLRPKGHPIHDMWIRVTLDMKFHIIDVAASSEAVPYPGSCETITPAYKQLIGLNLVKGFRRAAVERLGSVRGCSHLTELALGLPTAAIQTFAGLVSEASRESDRKPFQLDGCHALETTSEAVKRYYPRWFRTADSSSSETGVPRGELPPALVQFTTNQKENA